MAIVRNIAIVSILTITFSNVLFCQQSTIKEISLQFVKDNFQQDPDDFFVNVLQIKNDGDSSIQIVPKIILPDNWQLLTESKLLEIKPNSRKSIPVRATVSKQSIANYTYEIAAYILDGENNFVDEIVTHCIISAKSNWEIKALDVRKYFQPDVAVIPVDFTVINNGNITEHLQFDFQCGKEITIHKLDSNLINSELVLPAHLEVSCRIMLTYSKEFRFENFTSMLKIAAISKGKSVEVTYSFMKLSSNYDNYNRKQQMPGFIKLNVQNPHQKNVRYRLMTKGAIKLDKERNINYSFSNNNLINTDDFFAQSIYELAYESDSFEIGMGSGTSGLSRMLSYQKSIYSRFKQRYDSLSYFSGFARVSPFNGSVGAGFGQFYESDNVDLKTSIAGQTGKESYEKLISFEQEGNIYLSESSRLSFFLTGVRKKNQEDRNYAESGYSHNITYVVPFGNYL